MNKEAILKGTFSVDAENFLTKKQKSFILDVQKQISKIDIELIFANDKSFGYSAYMDTINSNWSENEEMNKLKFIQYLYRSILFRKAHSINTQKTQSLDFFVCKCNNFNEITKLIEIPYENE